MVGEVEDRLLPAATSAVKSVGGQGRATDGVSALAETGAEKLTTLTSMSSQRRSMKFLDASVKP